MTKRLRRASDKQVALLCRRYLVARFDELPGAAPHHSLGWAIATGDEGQHELIDARLGTFESGYPHLEVMADLWSRGVETIEWAVGPSGAATLLANMVRAPRVGHWQHDSAQMERFAGIPQREARTIAAADDVARQLLAAMTRAARRRGGQFASADAARACLHRTWQRLVERLGSERTALQPWASASMRPREQSRSVLIPCVRRH